MRILSRRSKKFNRDALSKLTNDAAGTAAIEMALVFPIFLAVTLGILAYGIYFGAAHSIQQLAADAARSSVAGLDDVERSSLAGAYVQNNSARYALLTASLITIQAAPNAGSSNDFVVTLSYDASNPPFSP